MTKFTLCLHCSVLVSDHTFRYIGCFIDTEDRVLPDEKFELGSKATIENCVQKCHNQGLDLKYMNCAFLAFLLDSFHPS